MPELPEVETVARGLEGALGGRRIDEVLVHAPALRHRLDRAALRTMLVGRRVRGVERRGKAIILAAGAEHRALIHLGMSGSFRVCPRTAERSRHEQVELVTGATACRYEDPRRFGMFLPLFPGGPAADFLERLGPEPLGPAFTVDHLVAALAGRRRAVKELLLDQAVVAGLGNIYVVEILHRARVGPWRAGAACDRAACRRIVRATRSVLREAIRCGGTTLVDHHALDGSIGRFARALRVYKREGACCSRCGARIVRATQGGRSTYSCPGCQD
ncbi:MAG: bifunctional DNA-formamidopyrimidine glycosylase/DNA-(apurinic or apyrimidinic site) lyase [Planctomycetota bacterium]